jgi:hypothetical protein
MCQLKIGAYGEKSGDVFEEGREKAEWEPVVESREGH